MIGDHDSFDEPRPCTRRRGGPLPRRTWWIESGLSDMGGSECWCRPFGAGLAAVPRIAVVGTEDAERFGGVWSG